MLDENDLDAGGSFNAFRDAYVGHMQQDEAGIAELETLARDAAMLALGQDHL